MDYNKIETQHSDPMAGNFDMIQATHQFSVKEDGIVSVHQPLRHEEE